MFFKKWKHPNCSTNCATTSTDLITMNWKQKPSPSSFNTLILKPNPIWALCISEGSRLQRIKMNVSRQTELDWSERKQAAMSRHSQLYYFTLQTTLSNDCIKSVCMCVFVSECDGLVYDRRGSHNIHISSRWMEMFWTLLLAGAW